MMAKRERKIGRLAVPLGPYGPGFSVVAVWTALVAVPACNSNGTGSDKCMGGDLDGVIGGSTTVLVSVSDTAFAVGGVDSGSDQRNIAVQNLSSLTLTLTNVGTKHHSFVVQCIATVPVAGCPDQSCFPLSANLSALSPGQSTTTTFVTPAVEGAYQFFSNEPGDTQVGADGAISGLVGAIVVM